MGRYVAKQPNGKYCVFSSIVDTIVAYDLTEQEVIDFYIEDEIEIIKMRAEKEIRNCKDFSQVVQDFYPSNETEEEFEEWCKSVGLKK